MIRKLTEQIIQPETHETKIANPKQNAVVKAITI